jgi:hypothetical protein
MDPLNLINLTQLLDLTSGSPEVAIGSSHVEEV